MLVLNSQSSLCVASHGCCVSIDPHRSSRPVLDCLLSLLLQFSLVEQNDLLLGQAMECAGMIGEAVGRTRFKSDGLAMMRTLMVRISPLGLHQSPG